MNHNNDELNIAGGVSVILAFFNSFFEIFNPLLTGIFYTASTIWVLVQIYYKIKNKGK
jgi:hypothetical protein